MTSETNDEGGGQGDRLGSSGAGGDGGPASGVDRGRSAWEGARSQQYNARREAVITVASALFEERGYAGVSLADIARELDITNNALYHYFENKEELAYSCSDRAQDRIDGYLDRAEADGGSGVERLGRFITFMLADAPGGPPLPLRMTYALGERLRGEVRARDDRQRFRLLKIIRDGMADGSIRTSDPVLTVDFLFAGSYSMYRRCQRGVASLEEVTAVVVDILNGVAAEAVELQTA